MKTTFNKRWISVILIFSMLLSVVTVYGKDDAISDNTLKKYDFSMQRKIYLDSEKCYMYHLVHNKSGATVLFKDNKDVTKQFGISFASSATDDKGANHVLEHSLLSGSEKYPIKNLFYYLQGNSIASTLNGFTMDDSVSYIYETTNGKDFDNLLGIYLDMVFNPLLKTEKNLFLQEGIRREYVNGKTQYNGVVYNEKLTRDSIVDENLMGMLKELYPNSVPGYDAGGNTEALKDLTYEDLMNVYNTYYIPSNSLVYVSGDIDLANTLSVLNEYFKKSKTNKPVQDYSVNALVPSEKVIKRVSKFFGADSSTCVGTTIAGPKVSNIKEYVATDMLMNMVMNDIANEYPMSSFALGTGGGVLTSSIVVQDIPDNEVQTVLNKYVDKYTSMKGMSSKEINDMVNKYKNSQNSFSNMIITVLNTASNGLLYTGDPLKFFELDSIYTELSNEGSDYFNDILDKYFINNPHSISAVYTPNENITSSARNELFASPDETEKIKQETAEFAAWQNEPVPQEIIDSIPKLDPDDFKEMPYSFDVKQDNIDQIPFIYCKSTLKQKNDSAILSFDLSSLGTREVTATQMLANLITNILREKEITDTYLTVYSNPGMYDSTLYKPTMEIRIDADSQKILDAVSAIKDILNDAEFLSNDMIKKYIPELLKQARSSADYYYFYDLFTGEQNNAQRWNQLASGASTSGGYIYYKYMLEASKSGIESIKPDLDSAKQKVFNKNSLSVFFQGNYEASIQLKQFVPSLIDGWTDSVPSKSEITLPKKKESVSLIDDSAQTAAVYQIGNTNDNGEKYCGQMRVLAKVLTSKYALPEIRAKVGSYGASVDISTDGSFTLSGARVPDIQAVLTVFEGMGDFLRNLNLTDTELNQFILSSVGEVDDYFYQWANNFGNDSFIKQYTMEDVENERQQILSTTLDDLKSFADLIDKMIGEKRIFLSANSKQVEQIGFKAKETQNIKTLFDDETTTTQHEPYIFGTGDGLFEPDRTITRAEVATLLCRLLSDDNQTQNEKVKYTDIPADAWYKDAVEKMYQLDIMHGYDDGLFRPDEVITGEEFLLVANRLGQLPQEFSVSSGPITRAESVRIINAAIGRKVNTPDLHVLDISGFSDVSKDHAFYADIMEASQPHAFESLSDGSEKWIGAEE